MSENTSDTANTVCWIDLATTDVTGAKAFYAGLFGWTASDTPAGDGMAYSMLELDGRGVGGLYALAPGMGDEPFWQVYVDVADVEAAGARALSAGGQVLVPPQAVMDYGSFSVLADPAGGSIAVWQSNEAQEPGDDCALASNCVGSHCWYELRSAKPDAVEPFYAELFGWATRISKSVPGGQYRFFQLGERDLAGLLPAAEDDPLPGWIVYFEVADLDASLSRVSELGGAMVSPPVGIEGIGRFAFARDPQGAGFALFQKAGTAAP